MSLLCIMMNEQLLSEIESYASKHGIAPATVTSRAVGNSRLHKRLCEGGSCTLGVADRLRQFMSKPLLSKKSKSELKMRPTH